MAKPLYRKFFKTLETLTVLNKNKNFVKEVIGDSTNNCRTLSVNQVIRYLDTVGDFETADKLSSVYDFLRSTVTITRPNNRTDAIELNEFVRAFDAIVLDDRDLRTKVGRILGGVLLA